jgi:Domain of unknown function (DUF4779)
MQNNNLKKILSFKDTGNHEGHFSKYGSDHKKHKNDEGEHNKGSHYDEESRLGHNAKKGKSEKGHYDIDDEGYKKKSGNAEKHTNYEKYAKNGAKDHHEEHSLEH